MRGKVLGAACAFLLLMGQSTAALAACEEVPYQREVTETLPEYVTVPGPVVQQEVPVLSGEWRLVMVPEARTGYTQQWVDVPRTVQVPTQVQVPVVSYVTTTVQQKVMVPKTRTVTVRELVSRTVYVTETYQEWETRTWEEKVAVYKTKYHHTLYYADGKNTSCGSWTQIFTCDRLRTNSTYLGHSTWSESVFDRWKVIQHSDRVKVTKTRQVPTTVNEWVNRQIQETYYVEETVSVPVQQQVTSWVTETRNVPTTVWDSVLMDVPYTYYVNVEQNQWVEFWTTELQDVQTYLSIPTGNFVTTTTLVWDVRLVNCEVNPA